MKGSDYIVFVELQKTLLGSVDSEKPETKALMSVTGLHHFLQLRVNIIACFGVSLSPKCLMLCGIVLQGCTVTCHYSPMGEFPVCSVHEKQAWPGFALAVVGPITLHRIWWWCGRWLTSRPLTVSSTGTELTWLSWQHLTERKTLVSVNPLANSICHSAEKHTMTNGLMIYFYTQPWVLHRELYRERLFMFPLWSPRETHW